MFNHCQEIRKSRATTTQYYPKYRTYLLRELVYCAECVANMPANVNDENYGKMRPQSNTQGRNPYYRCRARDFGRECSQTSVRAEIVEEQVIQVLKTLKPPADWRGRMIQAMGELLGDQQLENRVAEIKQVIECMDFRWDHGFITDQEAYLEERVKLQQELEQLTPIPEDDLERAADILQNFAKYWANCGDDPEAQHRLIKLIIERVYVQDEEVVAMTLKADYHVVLGHKANEPTEFTIDSSVYTCGSDGIRTRGLCLDRAAC